jgi:peroxiredoxin
MRLKPPQATPTLPLSDIDGHPIRIGDGRKLLLSVFREAACPFCNVRVYELTHDHDDLRARGLDIVAVFHSDERDVRRFIARQPRPFRMVADPDGRTHAIVGAERSGFGKLRAVLTRLPALLRGLRLLGPAQGAGRTGALMPADFLIDGSGRIVATHYGRDAGDHMPMARILQFASGDAMPR